MQETMLCLLPALLWAVLPNKLGVTLEVSSWTLFVSQNDNNSLCNNIFVFQMGHPLKCWVPHRGMSC